MPANQTVIQPISSAQQQQVISQTHYFIQSAADHYGKAFSEIPVLFDLSGKAAGMGLDLVRKIIGEMGGSVGVESRLGEGTVFRIVFPHFTV